MPKLQRKYEGRKANYHLQVCPQLKFLTGCLVLFASQTGIEKVDQSFLEAGHLVAFSTYSKRQSHRLVTILWPLTAQWMVHPYV